MPVIVPNFIALGQKRYRFLYQSKRLVSAYHAATKKESRNPDHACLGVKFITVWLVVDTVGHRTESKFLNVARWPKAYKTTRPLLLPLSAGVSSY